MNLYSINEKLPEDFEEVVVYSSLNDDVHIAIYKATSKTFDIMGVEDGLVKVTHWTIPPKQLQGKDVAVETWFKETYKIGNNQFSK